MINELINNVMNTPENTNPNVLRGQLNKIVAQGSSGISATLIGETPIMDGNNDVTSTDLCVFDLDGIENYNAILFISKDRTAFKLINYFPTAVTDTTAGLVVFDEYYSGTQCAVSFTLGRRRPSDIKSLHVNHVQVSGTMGNFYIDKPQAFDIYAITLDPTSWV